MTSRSGKDKQLTDRLLVWPQAHARILHLNRMGRVKHRIV